MHTSAPSPRLQQHICSPRAQLAPPAAAATTLHKQRSQPCSKCPAAPAWPRQQSRHTRSWPARPCQRGSGIAASQQQEADPRGLSGAAAAAIASRVDPAAALDLSKPSTGNKQTLTQPPAAASATGASTALEARTASTDAAAAFTACPPSKQTSPSVHGTVHSALRHKSLTLRVPGADDCFAFNIGA